jgi:DNA-binding MarR family transcriptional regulator
MNFAEDLSMQVMVGHKSFQHYINRNVTDKEVSQYSQLFLLLSRHGGKVAQKVLCEELQIEKPNMVAILDILVKKGYVTREVNHKDRRGKLISLTPQSVQILNELNLSFDDVEKNLEEEITWQEKYTCLLVLKKVNDTFKNLLNTTLQLTIILLFSI